MYITIRAYTTYEAAPEPVLHRRGEKRYIIVSIVRPRANLRIEGTNEHRSRSLLSLDLSRARVLDGRERIARR